MKTQEQLYAEARRKIGEADRAFMELVNDKENPLTREDLEANIQKRPALWGRYSRFLDKLPSSKK